MTARVVVEDDGAVKFLDTNGDPLSEEWIRQAKRQMGDQIRELVQDCCDKINARTEELGSIHLHTPGPRERIRYEPRDFETPEPSKPVPQPYGLFGRIFRSRRDLIDEDNAAQQSAYENTLEQWRKAKRTFEQAEAARKQLLEVRVLEDVAAMEEVLEGALTDISWPRETLVSSEIVDLGRTAMLDVDLPELEDMPTTSASVPGRGYKLNVKQLSASKLQKLYMQHVHAIGFRIIGETFAVLPTVKNVILSAYSQRPNVSTGHVEDQYLYSVGVSRESWEEIDFGNLAAIDVLTAFERFELRRRMTKSGVFQPIEPITIGREEG